MKICYVILACEKYRNTRCVWQKNTWLKDVEADPESNYYWIHAQPDQSNNHIVGYNTTDDYFSCPIKYKSFIQNNELTEYDYIFFCDDDTFVFHDRLKQLLNNYNPNESYLLGHWLQHEKYFPTMSGGAGFALTRELYKRVREYLGFYNNLPMLAQSDITLCLWIHMMGNYKWEDLQGKVHPENHLKYNYTDIQPHHLSFHYVTEDLFNYYYSVKDATTL
jgi:hypothetical protein